MDTPYEKLLAKLARAEVKFMIVGGVAVALNGFVRTTEDVAILIDASAESVTRLLDELGNFGEGHARELSPADFSERRRDPNHRGFSSRCVTMTRGKRYADLVGSTKTTRIDMLRCAISTPKHSLRSRAIRSVSRIGLMYPPCER
jgi:hypothetical protein